MADPYQPPESQNNLINDPANDPAGPRRIVVTWEKLRIYYNSILLIAGLAALTRIHHATGAPLHLTISSSIAFGLAANVCYFLGPLIELYLTAIHQTYDFEAGRKILFCCGTVLSLVVIAFFTFVIFD